MENSYDDSTPAPSHDFVPPPHDVADVEGENESENQPDVDATMTSPSDAAASADNSAAANDVAAAPIQFRRLHPRVRIVWIVEGITAALFWGGLFLAVDWFWLAKRDWWPLDRGVLAAVIGGLALVVGLIMPWPAYRRWFYAVREHDVLLCHGVFWRVRRSIPRRRIQHVDIDSGPIDRMIGLCELSLHTAGLGGDDGEIQGLTEPEAEALREQLLREDWAAHE